MDPENEQTIDTDQINDQIDPWQAAFDALSKEQENDVEDDTESENDRDDGETGNDETIAKEINDGSASNEDDESSDGSLQGEFGGSSNVGGTFDQTDNSFDSGDFGMSQEDIESFNNSIVEQAKESAIKDIAQAFIKKGVRNRNGKLGANIDDPDICKRDEDGVPTFYNPDTGREFTGDNPRRQAMEWVEDYNKELAEAFNNACNTYVNKILEIEKPRLETIQFAPTYEKLDPIRKAMLDSMIEDYEVKDADGAVVGYSCDLNKALAAVNRQVAMVQKHAKVNAPDKASDSGKEKEKSKGPALDIKSSNSASPKEKPEFKNLAEAMEWEQDQLLAKNKKN